MIEFRYFPVGEEIFPLQEWLIWTYPGSSLINDESIQEWTK